MIPAVPDNCRSARRTVPHVTPSRVACVGLWLLAVLAVDQAIGAPPVLSYFDPPRAPQGATVQLVGENLSGITSFRLVQHDSRHLEVNEFTVVSDTAISFQVPEHDEWWDDARFGAWVENDDGISVTVPPDAEVIRNGALQYPQWFIRRVVAGEPVSFAALHNEIIFVEPGGHVQLSQNYYGFYFVKAGGTVDLTRLDFGTDILEIYHEPGATIIGPEPIFTPNDGGYFLLREVPSITAWSVSAFNGGPVPPVVSLTVAPTADGTITPHPDKPTYYLEDLVTFTAVPGAGSSFESWGAPFSDQPNPMTVQLTGNTTVTANFQTGHTIAASSEGGRIVLEPALTRYQPGQSVTATFHPHPGHVFAGWEGDVVSDQNPVTFEVHEDIELMGSTTPPPELPLAWSWQPDYAASQPNAPTDFWTETAIDAQGRVIVGYVPYGGTSTDGEIHQFDQEGNKLWSSMIPVRDHLRAGVFMGSPMVLSDGDVVISSGSKAHRLSGGDGQGKWEWEIPIAGSPKISIAAPISVFLSHPNEVHILQEERGISVLSDFGILARSRLVTRGGVPQPFGISRMYGALVDAEGSVHLSASPAFLKLTPDLSAMLDSNEDFDFRSASWNRTLTMAEDGSLWSPRAGNVLTPSELFRVDPSGGDPVAIPGTAGVTTTPIVTQNGSIVFPDGSGRLVCLDAASLTERWSIAGFANVSPIAARDGSIFAVGDDPRRPAIYQISADGEVLAHYPHIEDPSAAAPEAQLALDLEAPRPLATFALGPEGTLYVTSRNGTLYALEVGSPLADSSWPKAHGSPDNGSRVLPLAPTLTRPIEADTSDPSVVVLSFAFRARPAATVQWFHEGVPVEGAAGPELILSDIDASDLGTYSARLINSAGTTDTDPFELELGFAVEVPATSHVNVVTTPDIGIVLPGTEMELLAVPDPGFEFLAWAGTIDSTTNPLQITVDRALTIFPVVLDVAAPTLTWTSPAADSTTPAGLTTLSGTVADNDAVTALTWSLDGSPPAAIAPAPDGAFSVADVPLRIGPNVFTLEAIDPTGNRTTSTRTLHWEPPRTVRVGATSATEGQLASQVITLSSSGEVAGLTLRITYDPVHLDDPRVEFASALQHAFTTVNTSTPGEIQLSFSLTGETIPAGATPLAAVAFRARSVPQPLESPISVEILDIADAIGTAFPDGNGAVDGAISLNPRKFTGDFNANDRLDVGDAFRLQQLLVGNEEIRAWDVALSDLNGTGSLDAGDVIRILRAAAAIDPQPEPPAPVVARLMAPLPPVLLEHAALRLVIDNPSAGPGEILTARIVTMGTLPDITGAAFVLEYPVEALRLVDAASHLLGPAVPSGSSSLWNVSPAISDYGIQDGRLAFAASSRTEWPDAAVDPSVAEIRFVVQPATPLRTAWALRLLDAEVATDSGFAMVPIAEQHAPIVPAPVPFADWQDAQFPPAQRDDPTISGPLADPDRDGRPNLVEFFCGSDPLVADGESVLQPVLFDDSADVWLGARFRRDVTPSGLAYRIESSADGDVWVDEGAGSLGGAEVVSSMVDPDTATETVTVRFPQPIGAPAEAPRFLRLLVTLE